MEEKELRKYAENVLDGLNHQYVNYSDANGQSMYFDVDGIKVRFSDHSVTNKDRMQNEVHFDIKKIGTDSQKFGIEQSLLNLRYRLGDSSIKYGKRQMLMPSGKYLEGFGYTETKEYAKGGLIAPNGKKSNLTALQYKLVRLPEFKAWFGDWENSPETSSKVVDENGEPLVVYHGTNSKFTIFKIKKRLDSITNSFYESGLWFFAPSFDKQISEEERNYLYEKGNAEYMAKTFMDNKDDEGNYIENKVIKVFLNVRNPKIIDGVTDRQAESLKYYSQEMRKNKNNDAVIMHGSLTDGNMFRDDINVLNANQIKLADGSNTTFDSNNPDIRYKKGGMTNKGYVSYKDKYNTKYGYKKSESHSLEQISKDTGVSMKGLQQIYNKGIGAYKTNPTSVRPNVKSKEQWAMARVYSSVMGGKASKVDANELKMAKGGLIAPNGKKSNLTALQYKLVRLPEFKDWFGDWENDPENASKVVDENGEPKVVFRGSKSKNPNYIPHKHELSNGIYFSTKKDVAELYTTSFWQNWVGRIFECFLNIRNLDYYDTLKLKSNIYQADFEFYNKLVLESKKNNFDGICWDNFIDVPNLEIIFPKEPKDYMGKTFIVFETNQIKLADGTNTTFDGNNPDIRFDGGGNVEDLISKGIVELKMFDTKPEHAKEYGFDVKKPLYVQSICISENERLKGTGKKVLEYIDEYAVKNGHDLIFGHITQKASFTKNSRPSDLCDIDLIKEFLIKGGYSTIKGNNDFYKVIKTNPDIRFDEGGNVNDNQMSNTEKTKQLIKFTQNQIDYLSDQLDIVIDTYDDFYDEDGNLDKAELDYLEYPETICEYKDDLENLQSKIQNAKGSSYTKQERDFLINRIDMTLDSLEDDNEVSGGKRSLISALKKLQEQDISFDGVGNVNDNPTSNTEKLIQELKKHSNQTTSELMTNEYGEKYRFHHWKLKYPSASNWLVQLFMKASKENTGKDYHRNFSYGNFSFYYDRPEMKGKPNGSMQMKELEVLNNKFNEGGRTLTRQEIESMQRIINDPLLSPKLKESFQKVLASRKVPTENIDFSRYPEGKYIDPYDFSGYEYMKSKNEEMGVSFLLTGEYELVSKAIFEQDYAMWLFYNYLGRINISFKNCLLWLKQAQAYFINTMPVQVALTHQPKAKDGRSYAMWFTTSDANKESAESRLGVNLTFEYNGSWYCNEIGMVGNYDYQKGKGWGTFYEERKTGLLVPEYTETSFHFNTLIHEFAHCLDFQSQLMDNIKKFKDKKAKIDSGEIVLNTEEMTDLEKELYGKSLKKKDESVSRPITNHFEYFIDALIKVLRACASGEMPLTQKFEQQALDVQTALSGVYGDLLIEQRERKRKEAMETKKIDELRDNTRFTWQGRYITEVLDYVEKNAMQKDLLESLSKRGVQRPFALSEIIELDNLISQYANTDFRVFSTKNPSKSSQLYEDMKAMKVETNRIINNHYDNIRKNYEYGFYPNTDLDKYLAENCKVKDFRDYKSWKECNQSKLRIQTLG